MEKKYILTDEIREFYGKILHRIQAVRDFDNVKTGDLGGWIEKEENLSHGGNCWIYGNAVVRGNALVRGDAMVGGYAQVCDNAQIYGNAKVSGNVLIYGDAIICEEMLVSYSKIDTDLRTDIAASLRGQCNLLLIKNKVIAYKIVNRNLTSLFDKNFVYKIGEIAEVKNPDKSHASCASGLHFSNLTYWDDNIQKYKDKTYLVAEINVEDIITIQQGKIRCKKAKILDKVDIQ